MTADLRLDRRARARRTPTIDDSRRRDGAGAALRRAPHLAALFVALLAALLAPAATRAEAPTVSDDNWVLATSRYVVAVGGSDEYHIPVDLLAFASDPEGEALSFSVAPPTASVNGEPAGSVSHFGAALVVFRIPVAELTALESAVTFDFTASDGSASTTGTVIVWEAQEFARKTASSSDDSFSVPIDQPSTLPVLANDSGVDWIASFTQPSRGTVAAAASDTELVFTPPADFAIGETVTFTYVADGLRGEAPPATVTLTGAPPPETVLQVVRAWDQVPVAHGDTVAFPEPVAVGEADSIRFELVNPTEEDLEITNAATAVSGECFSVIEAIPGTVPPASTLTDSTTAPPGFRIRVQCPTGGTKTATVTLETRSASGVRYAPFSYTVRADVLLGPTPLVVRQHWDGAAIPNGATIAYPADAIFEFPTSFAVDLENPTAESVLVANAGSAISGSGYWATAGAPVPASVGAGTTELFRVRLLWDHPEKVTGTVTLETTNAAGEPYEPYSFQVEATLVIPEMSILRGWPGSDPTPIAEDAVIELPTVAAAGDTNHSVAFQIHNTGLAGTLGIKNPDATLVDGECFSIRSGGLPGQLVTVGNQTPFRVWWGGSCGAGTYTATIRVHSNAWTDFFDPFLASDSFYFTVVGRVAAVPELTCHPTDTRVVIGQPASLSVCVANDDGTFTYAWFKDGQPIAGSGPTLSFSAVTAADEGSYHVEVDGGELEAVTSQAARLTVVEKPVVSRPANQAVPVGGTATFSVTVSSPAEDGPFSYLWQQLPPGASTFQTISGATSASLSVGPVTLAMDGTRYRCLVSNDAGLTNSGSAALTVQPPDVAVTRNWDGVAVGEGTTFDFGTVERGVATSRLFRITNTGQATLTIGNPTSLVSGTCWSQIENAASTVAPGGYTTFRVRLYCTTAGTKTGQVTIHSDDPSSPYVFYLRGDVVASDVLVRQNWDGATVSPGATVDFGSVETGVATSRRFQITNTGQATLTIGNPTSLVSGTCWSQIETPSSTVAPGATTYFRVRLYCNSTGTMSGTVTISSNDPTSPYRFNVSGTVTAPDPGDVTVYRAWNGVLQGEGTTFLFPDTTVGTAVSRRFQITNTGTGTLTISNPTSFVSGTCWSQIENAVSTVAPGESTYFRVRLVCSTTGTKSGTITIYSNDTSSPYRFYVQGTVK